MVTIPVSDVTQLRSILAATTIRPIAEAVFVDELGEWKVVAIIPSLEGLGARPIFVEMYRMAEQLGKDPEIVAHLMLLDADDSDAEVLLKKPVTSLEAAAAGGISIAAIPGFRGAVIAKAPQVARIQGMEFEQRVIDTVRALGLQVTVGGSILSSYHDAQVGGYMVRPDAWISIDGAEVALEASLVSRKNIKSRLGAIAGLANLLARPVVWVVGSSGDRELPLGSYGVVPVFPVNFDPDDSSELLSAVRQATLWVQEHNA